VSQKSKDLPPDAGLGTRAVHAGELHRNPHHAITTPVVSSATYVFDDTAALRDYFEGRTEREEYGRYGNPTVRAAERKLAALDGAPEAALFASGMAAGTTTLLTLLKAGDHLVMTSDCYRRTRQFVSTILSRYGVTATLVEPGDFAGLEKALVPGKTKVILSESPTNPYLRVVDMGKLVAIKQRFGGAKLVIDATFATPINQRPLEAGADLVIHSCTKYLAGHNDILAGVVCGNEGLVSAIRELRSILGAVLDPHSAYLLLRGLKTLALRVKRQNESACSSPAGWKSSPRSRRCITRGWPVTRPRCGQGADDRLRRRGQLPGQGRPGSDLGVHRRLPAGADRPVAGRRRDADRAAGADVVLRAQHRAARGGGHPQQPGAHVGGPGGRGRHHRRPAPGLRRPVTSR
jgi:cystathionine gamma-synthase